MLRTGGGGVDGAGGHWGAQLGPHASGPERGCCRRGPEPSGSGCGRGQALLSHRRCLLSAASNCIYMALLRLGWPEQFTRRPWAKLTRRSVTRGTISLCSLSPLCPTALPRAWMTSELNVQDWVTALSGDTGTPPRPCTLHLRITHVRPADGHGTLEGRPWVVRMPTYVFFLKAWLNGTSLPSVDLTDLRWLCHTCFLGCVLQQVNLKTFILCLLVLLLPFPFGAVRVVEP